MTFKDWLEIASDLLGAASGIALLIPAHGALTAREKLEMAMRAAREADLPELAKSEIAHLTSNVEAALARFSPGEFRLLKLGAWLLLASFALKLVYHWIDKT